MKAICLTERDERGRYRTQSQHPQPISQEFGAQLRALGFNRSDFSLGSNYEAGGPNISEVPKMAVLGGAVLAATGRYSIEIPVARIRLPHVLICFLRNPDASANEPR